MSDEIFGDINQDELLRCLFEEITNNEGSPESDRFAKSLSCILFDGTLHMTTAQYLSEAATLFMVPTYRQMRDEGKNHCESLIAAQNNFIEIAYNIMNGQDFHESGAHDIIRSSFKKYQTYIGGDSNQYAKYLSKITHNALDQVHGDCKGLEENLTDLNKRYTI